jgi:hypothetical protein
MAIRSGSAGWPGGRIRAVLRSGNVGRLPRVEPRETWAGSGARRHEGGQDVVRVAVQVAAGPVIPHRGARVGMAGGDLRGQSCRRRRSPAGRRPAPPPVCSQAPRTQSSPPGLTRAKARRNVDSSAGPRAAPSTASTSGPASAAHCPIAANDPGSTITAAIPTASRPASEYRRPPLRGSGTWARRSTRYWLRAAGIGEDAIGGRASLAADDGERRNFHRSARALPAARGHAGRIIRRYHAAGHSLTSRLCRVPGGGRLVSNQMMTVPLPVAWPVSERQGGTPSR